MPVFEPQGVAAQRDRVTDLRRALPDLYGLPSLMRLRRQQKHHENDERHENKTQQRQHGHTPEQSRICRPEHQREQDEIGNRRPCEQNADRADGRRVERELAEWGSAGLRCRHVGPMRERLRSMSLASTAGPFLNLRAGFGHIIRPAKLLEAPGLKWLAPSAGSCIKRRRRLNPVVVIERHLDLQLAPIRGMERGEIAIFDIAGIAIADP